MTKYAWIPFTSSIQITPAESDNDYDGIEGEGDDVDGAAMWCDDAP